MYMCTSIYITPMHSACREQISANKGENGGGVDYAPF